MVMAKLVVWALDIERTMPFSLGSPQRVQEARLDLVLRNGLRCQDRIEGYPPDCARIVRWNCPGRGALCVQHRRDRMHTALMETKSFVMLGYHQANISRRDDL
jgi:hypothetical protein